MTSLWEETDTPQAPEREAFLLFLFGDCPEADFQISKQAAILLSGCEQDCLVTDEIGPWRAPGMPKRKRLLRPLCR